MVYILLIIMFIFIRNFYALNTCCKICTRNFETKQLAIPKVAYSLHTIKVLKSRADFGGCEAVATLIIRGFRDFVRIVLYPV